MRSPKRDRVFSGEQEKIRKAWRPLMHLPPQRATAAYPQLRDEVGKRAIPPRCGSAWRDSSPLEKAEPLDWISQRSRRPKIFPRRLLP